MAQELVHFFCECGIVPTEAKRYTRELIKSLGVFSVPMLAAAVKPTSILLDSRGRAKLNQIDGANASRIAALLSKKAIPPLTECTLLAVMSSYCNYYKYPSAIFNYHVCMLSIGRIKVGAGSCLSIGI